MSSTERIYNPLPSSGEPQTASKPSSDHDRKSISHSPPPLHPTVSPTLSVEAVHKRTSLTIFSGTAGSPPFPASTKRHSLLSPEATDRVFPVRSVVSVDSTTTLIQRGEAGDEFPGTHAINDCDPKWHETRRDSSAINFPPGKQSTPSSRPPTSPRLNSSVALPQPLTSENLRSRGSLDSHASRNTVEATHHEINNLMGEDTVSLKSSRTTGTDGGLGISSRPASIRSMPNDAHLTARFKHIFTDGGHVIIAGRDGEILQRCEDEPIHIPGAIQSFGLLIALREEADKLIVRVVSENSTQMIGYSPHQLFKLSNFLSIFTEEQADNLLDHLDFIRDETDSDTSTKDPEVFMLSLRTPGRRIKKFWCAMHINKPNKDLIICELELEDDHQNPLVPAGVPDYGAPEDTLGSKPTPEEFAESTVAVSKPLRMLRSARNKRGEAAAMEVFNIMTQVQEQLTNASSLDSFLKILIGVVKELTGFHRVMVYQFDQSFNGRVVSELVDPGATKDLYMGLNFPVSDIPKQARDLYRINKVRLLYDRDQETARLVCRTLEDLESPLDMTYTYLRAMSPVHLKYLSNMAVRSSMSISINAFDELWGLIACHSYGPKGMRVSFPIRKMCRLVGDTASRNIERLSYASRLQARKLINTANTTENPSGYIVASSEDLLDLFSADCGALSIRDETKLLGKSEGHLQEILAMLEYLRLRKIGSFFTSVDMTTDFADLRYPPRFQYIAGLLFVPLSSNGNDFIVFFRKSSAREVRWAGNPYEKCVTEGSEGYLEPRKSFRAWSEVVVGKCRDWSQEEIETSAVLCLVYGKFIEVWRQKEAALQRSQLQKLLLANSAHEVRTPLNAVINYLEIALEGNLDAETRDNLSKSHSASKSLVYVINDLLDLTKTEEGLELVKEEVFDFHVMMEEATKPFRGDARRKRIDYRVVMMDDIPQYLVGDPRRVRQVVSNIVANAIQNTVAGSVNVEVCRSLEDSGPGKITVDFTVEDTGAGMPQDKVDALFCDLEQVSSESEVLHSTMLEKKEISKPPNENGKKATLGLGLAFVARAIRNMNGQLRVKTEPGKGSRFVIGLVLGITDKSDCSVQVKRRSVTGVAPSSDHPAGPPAAANSAIGGWGSTKSAQNRRRRLSRASQESSHSINSVGSGNSNRSGKSDVDRLIDDIQRPHLVDQTSSDTRRRRSSNHGPLSRSATAGDEGPTFLQSANAVDRHSDQVGVCGEEKITDSRTPLTAIRIPEDEGEKPRQTGATYAPKVAFELSQLPSASERPWDAEKLAVLVAEDDPINSKIIKKRLEKLGHTVHLTVNGEECSSAFGDRPSSYDVVLMDLQMPIVDGFTSTKMIRSYEKTHGDTCLSTRARANGRIPVFALSASLAEKERENYIKTGFDGWILKPVNFQRVGSLLKGIIEEDTRNACLFKAGHWERGGWFETRQAATHLFTADTAPSHKPPTLDSPKPPASSKKR